MHADELIAKYPLVSDQVNKEQVGVILTELERVLAAGVPGAIVEFGCYIEATRLHAIGLKLIAISKIGHPIVQMRLDLDQSYRAMPCIC